MPHNDDGNKRTGPSGHRAVGEFRDQIEILTHLGDYGGNMAEVTIHDPDEYRENVPVDDRGRVVVGKKLAGERIRVCVEVIDD